MKRRYFTKGRVLAGAYLPTTHLEKMMVITEVWLVGECLGTEVTNPGPWPARELLCSTQLYTGRS